MPPGSKPATFAQHRVELIIGAGEVAYALLSTTSANASAKRHLSTASTRSFVTQCGASVAAPLYGVYGRRVQSPQTRRSPPATEHEIAAAAASGVEYATPGVRLPA